MESIHKTVLLNETIEGLNLENKSGIVLDATFGGGGHSLEILKRYPKIKIVALDQDKGAWQKAKSKFKGLEKRITFLNLNFRDLNTSPEPGTGEFPCTWFRGEKVDAIIFDLGLSSDQLENSGRGFSFMKDEPLLMTMKEDIREEDITAKEIVNNWSEESLADIIYGYGEERFGRRIAKGIVEGRKNKKIETTFDLLKIIEGSVPGGYRRGKLHFATKTFQALRIAVNDELNTLQAGLEEGFKILKKEGRMAVISFHSLEDRIVKRFYKEKEKENKAKLINKKPIIPKEEEIKINRRSRSSKLRILSRL